MNNPSAVMSPAQSTKNKTADTTRTADTSSLQRPELKEDPKLGFKDLFTEENSTGINTRHLNPKAISFVEDYIRKQGKKMEEMKGWGKPYFDMMDAILTQHGIPKELKYLAVIESHLKVYATSWAGAVGPWQFMPATARRMGLKVTDYIDERTDYYKSTHAAARYLTELFNIYGDWLLVIAAYNGGPGNVNAAIKKSGSTDFWTLQNYLPVESKNHVKKFIATHYIMEGEGGVTTLTKDETGDYLLTAQENDGSQLSKDELEHSQTLELKGKYNSLVIAKNLLMDITEFNRYNPGFDKLLAANGSYTMRLAAEKMDLFRVKKVAILNESIQLLLDSMSQPLYTSDKRSTH
ncbi:MAG: transglycosylase SLT domain-containing protein [Terrimonas sp.]|nr:transglycosylase SLT domain-containing protein [Terrimonas sp.]